MADLFTSGIVAANYRTFDSSKLGTRVLDFYTVAGDFSSDPYAVGSLFQKAVRGLQLQAELYFIGAPDNKGFVVAVANDTANNDAENRAGAITIAEAVSAATGGAITTVTKLTVAGDKIA